MSALALLIMQVGPNPSVGAIPDVPDELANRPQREPAEVVETTPSPRSEYLSRCLALTTSEPEEALDFAQAWRVQVDEGESHEVKKLTVEQLTRQLEESKALLPGLALYQIHSASLDVLQAPALPPPFPPTPALPSSPTRWAAEKAAAGAASSIAWPSNLSSTSSKKNSHLASSWPTAMTPTSPDYPPALPKPSASAAGVG